GEGAESEQLPRRVDELRDPRVLLLELLDDRADRLLPNTEATLGGRGPRVSGGAPADAGALLWVPLEVGADRLVHKRDPDFGVGGHVRKDRTAFAACARPAGRRRRASALRRAAAARVPGLPL